ncbi:MAG: TcpQ domain-containing protein [Acidiferrobacterales bacterium]|nr:TcpQ domain-containing protein [Acidiferrobacterales bacterium]
MKLTTKILKRYPIMMMLTCIAVADAADNRDSNRYTVYAYTAESNEEDLLSTIVETTFPARIATVGSAIDYVLLRSGYRHVPTDAVSDALLLTLPQVHRSIGPVDTRTALQTLIGSSWNLLEDQTKRVIWFQYAGALPQTEVIPEDPPQDPNPEVPVYDHDVAEPKHQRASQKPTKQVWTLNPSLTLRQNLARWALEVDWALEWNSDHDYEILYSAAYQGTLQDAVKAVLEHYRTSPFGLTATFFEGNSVLLIEPNSPGSR